MKALTPQQEKFAKAVASGLNQSDAYRKAYKAGQMKLATINKRSGELMQNGAIRGRVAALAAKSEEVFAVNTGKLLQEAHRLAHSDIANIMHPDGKVKLPHELDADTRAAISSFKIDEYGRIEYKFWDKNAAQERLFKHKGLFKLDNEQQPPSQITHIELVALKPKLEQADFSPESATPEKWAAFEAWSKKQAQPVIAPKNHAE